MAPTFTTAEWLQVAHLLEFAAGALRQYAQNDDAGRLLAQATLADDFLRRIWNFETEPSKLRPTGDAFRDTLVSERLNLRRD